MSEATRHVPMRSCVGCNSRDAQSRLVRVALVDGRPVWDEARRLPGRGAWVHRAKACFEAFASRKPFIRSLRASLPAPERRRLVDQIPLV